MSKEKQIDEMLNEICTNCHYLLVCEDEHLKQVCRFAKMAKVLYDAGYRKRRGGEWKLGKSGCMYFCSECNYAAHPREVDEWSYCPRCGAKMKGGE